MKELLKGAVLAFSSFSKVPMPQFEWHAENMRFMMCFFPLVGLFVGAMVAAWLWISYVVGFGAVLTGAGIAIVPVAVTGGIHLDGFCDVVDAQSSHALPERKREILKDPHVGAFAIIGMASYLVAYAAVGSELAPSWQTATLVVGLHVASRCMSGIATLAFPTSASKGMLSMFHESADSRRALVVLMLEYTVCAGVMVCASPLAAACVLATGLACLVALYPFCKSQFGGMSGDLAGFFLQVAELAMLFTLVVVAKVVGL